MVAAARGQRVRPRVGARREVRRGAAARGSRAVEVRLRPGRTCRRASSARFIATCSTSYYRFAEALLAIGLIWPALEHCLKCSHLFNMLDSSNSIGVTERTAYILRVRQLAVGDREGVRRGETGAEGGGGVTMDRELLLEIGCEELPASWLPGLTKQIGEVVVARAARAPPAARSAGRDLQHAAAPDRARRAACPSGRPISRSSSTGRRCRRLQPPTARRRRRPPALRPSRASTSRRSSASRRRRATTSPTGSSSAGKAAVDVLPDVLGGDAARADVSEADALGRAARRRSRRAAVRPARFAGFCSCTAAASCRSRFARTPAAQTGQVQDVASGAVTYGHRFLTTSGRAGRAIKVRSFDEYRARLLENFVILERERAPRQDRARARREGAAAAGTRQPRRPRRVRPAAGGARSRRVPVGRRRHVRARVPRAAGRSADDDADSSSALLSGRGRGRQAEERVSGGHQHRAGQRAHDRAQRRARRHGAAARRAVLLGSAIARRRSSRGSIGSARCCFTRSSARYKEKAERIERLARLDRARGVRRVDEMAAARGAGGAAREGRPRRPTWCASSPSCRGRWAASTRARKGCPRRSGRRSTSTTCRSASKPTRRRPRAQLGKAAVTWAAVSLADKLDTIVGLFAAGEKPTGSRDPYGLRRAAQGVVEDPGGPVRAVDGPMPAAGLLETDRAGAARTTTQDAEAPRDVARIALCEFLHGAAAAPAASSAGFGADEIRAVVRRHRSDSGRRMRCSALEALRASARDRRSSQRWPMLFKRVKNIAKELDGALDDGRDCEAHGPAARAGRDRAADGDAMRAGRPSRRARRRALRRGHAASSRASAGLSIDSSTDVLVMVDDPALREARLALLARAPRTTILRFADISEIAPESRRLKPADGQRRIR